MMDWKDIPVADNTSDSSFQDSDNESVYIYEVDDIFLLTSNIDKYTMPIIFSFGIPANIIMSLIFSTKTFRKASCGLNLVGKSLSDAVFLICTCVVWLESIHVDILHTQGICQAVVYLTYVSAFTSVWFVVALALESLIRIRYPFKVGSFCTPRKATNGIVVMVVSSFLLYFPTLWINTVDEIDGFHACQRDTQMLSVTSAYTYVDTLVTLILPSVTIVIFLILTFEAVWSSKIRSRQMFRDLKVSLSVLMQQQVARMLSAVSVSFILLTLPSHITRVALLLIVWIDGIPDISPEQYLTQHLFQLLYYLSFTINIVTYAIFCPKVRRIMEQAFASMCRRSSQTDPQAEMTSNSFVTDHNSGVSPAIPLRRPIKLTMEARIQL